MALPKKQKAAPGYCQPCCSFWCIGFAVFLIVIGTLIPAGFDKKVQEKLYQGMIANAADGNYTHWTKDNRDDLGVRVMLRYHFFDVKNPTEVMNGDAPVVEKVGPYVFRKYVTEGQVQYFDGKKKRASRKLAELEFVPGQSCSSCTLDDELHIPSLLASWWWGKCKDYTVCMLDGDANWYNCDENNDVARDDDGNPVKNGNAGKCKDIADNGIFQKTTVAGAIYGYKFFGKIPHRLNQGHQRCPLNVQMCRDEYWTGPGGQYDPGTGGVCSGAGKCGGQFSWNWASKKMKAVASMTGYDNKGCMKLWEYEDHGVICDNKDQVGRIWKDNCGDDPTCAGKTMEFERHMKPPPRVRRDEGIDYNTLSKAELEMKFQTYVKWFDNTPYDTSDDLEVDATYDMKEGKPCNWKNTNGKKGCPFFDHVEGPFLVQSFWDPRRLNKEPIKSFDTGFGWRTFDLVFDGEVEDPTAHDANVPHLYKYVISPDDWKADGKNKKYGMDSTGSSYDFPGAGTWPMKRISMGLPYTYSLPHWYGGGDRADKWNEAMGLRKPNKEDDEWAIYYEPETGVPFHNQLQYQFNLLYTHSDIKIQKADGTVLYDFTDMTFTRPDGTEHTGVDMSKIGAWMHDVSPSQCDANQGCGMQLPLWQLQLSIELGAHTSSKIRNLLFGLGKLAGLKGMLSTLVVVGSIILVIVFSLNMWKHFGHLICDDSETQQKQLKNAA